MNLTDYTAMKLQQHREQEFEVERKHKGRVKDAKEQKKALLGFIPYKIRK